MFISFPKWLRSDIEIGVPYLLVGFCLNFLVLNGDGHVKEIDCLEEFGTVPFEDSKVVEFFGAVLEFLFIANPYANDVIDKPTVQNERLLG